MDNYAAIIGNGPSRKEFPLEILKGVITTFGCNALYRDFAPDYDLPDYLVAIDDPITEEIMNSDFPKDRFIHPPYEEQFESSEYSPYVRRSNAGMNAMIEAIKMGYNKLICIGFDFIIKDEQYSIKNIYDGTNCYTKEFRATYEDNLNRVKYFRWFARKNKNVHFFFSMPERYETHNMPESNVSGISHYNVIKNFDTE